MSPIGMAQRNTNRAPELFHPLSLRSLPSVSLTISVCVPIPYPTHTFPPCPRNPYIRAPTRLLGKRTRGATGDNGGPLAGMRKAHPSPLAPRPTPLSWSRATASRRPLRSGVKCRVKAKQVVVVRGCKGRVSTPAGASGCTYVSTFWGGHLPRVDGGVGGPPTGGWGWMGAKHCERWGARS